MWVKKFSFFCNVYDVFILKTNFVRYGVTCSRSIDLKLAVNNFPTDFYSFNTTNTTYFFTF